jgi:ATP-binding cassette subfamily B protein
MSTVTASVPRSAAVTLGPRAVRSLSGLLPFLRPYRTRIALAALFLVLAALSTLVFPIALKSLIDQGFVATDPGTRVMALREHFFALFGVGVAIGVFSALRFYLVSWLGERVTADLRDAVYAHVVRQSPEFFETTQTGEVLSRLTTDTTLVQTVVGSSLSMGLRNAVMGVGAMAMLIVTNPYVMTQVLGILVVVVLPSLYFGRRVRKLSRASQDRVADLERDRGRGAECDSGGAELHAGGAKPSVSRCRPRARSRPRSGAPGCVSVLVAFISRATLFGALLWVSIKGRRRCCAATSAPVILARPSSTDHPGRQRRGRFRGLWRPARAPARPGG